MRRVLHATIKGEDQGQVVWWGPEIELFTKARTEREIFAKI